MLSYGRSAITWGPATDYNSANKGSYVPIAGSRRGKSENGQWWLVSGFGFLEQALPAAEFAPAGGWRLWSLWTAQGERGPSLPPRPRAPAQHQGMHEQPAQPSVRQAVLKQVVCMQCSAVLTHFNSLPSLPFPLPPTTHLQWFCLFIC